MAADAKQFQRIIELPDAELLALVKEKGQIVEAGRGISRRMQDLVEQHEKLSQEMAVQAGKGGTVARRIFKRIKKLTKGQLTEWEMPLTTEIRDGKVVLIVEDSLETFKAEFRGHDKFGAHQAPKKKLQA